MEQKRKRHVWSKEEDERLVKLVNERKDKNWVKIAEHFKNRSNKDCRDRYFLHLSPNVEKRKWTYDEEQLLIEKFMEIGPKWVALTAFFDKRSSNDLKNRVKLIQKRKKKLKPALFDSDMSLHNQFLLTSSQESLMSSPVNQNNLFQVQQNSPDSNNQVSKTANTSNNDDFLNSFKISDEIWKGAGCDFNTIFDFRYDSFGLELIDKINGF